MPGFIGPTELIVFGIVALLVLGPKKLPEMGRSLGKGMREFKNSVSGEDSKNEIDVTKFEPAPETAATTPVATTATTTTVEETQVDLEAAR